MGAHGLAACGLFMNSSHLHIKFGAIVKPPFRPHLPLSKSRTRPPKLPVGAPDITPELGASNNVRIRQCPPLQPSGGAARASYLHTSFPSPISGNSWKITSLQCGTSCHS